MAGSEASAQDDAQYQFWPEVDVYYRFDAQWRLFALASLSRAREIDYTDARVAVHIDYSFFPIGPLIGVPSADFERRRLFQFRAGYGYAQSLGEHAGDYREQQGVFEASLSVFITEKILFVDRNRGDFRFLADGFSFRYRNRVRVEQQFATDFVTLNPHASIEAFFDTQYSTINRIAYDLGIEWTLSMGAVVDTYYSHQNNTRTSPAVVNAFGLSVSLFY